MIVVGVLLAVTCAFKPVTAVAQSHDDTKSDLLLRIDGPASVGPSDSVGTLIVIGNDATVLGSVEDLVVINGTARVAGTVKDNLVLFNGRADLAPTARIGKDVLLYRSTITRALGAHITGRVQNETGLSFGARGLWLLWLSLTIAIIAAGIVFAYLAGDQLNGVAEAMKSEWRGTLIATLFVVVGLPTAAVVSFMTGIGVVLGLFILFVTIPMLSLVGLLVAGAALGRAVLGIRSSEQKTYAAIALGLFMIQTAAVVPGLGGLIVLASSQFGAGALVYHAWTRGKKGQLPRGLIVQPA